MSQNGKPRSRWRRRAGLAGLGLALLVLVVVLVLRVRFAGDRLATTVESMLSDSIRGRVEIGSVDWPVGDLSALVTGGWVRVTVHDLAVYDEFDELVLETPLVTGQLDLYPALLDQNVVVRDLRLPDGGYALIKEVREPYPAHQYDDSAVSLVSAFYAKDAPRFHAGISAGDGSVFDLQDFHIAGATLEFRFPSFTAVAEDVHGDGFLYFDGSDPIASKLFYSLTPKARLATITVGEVPIVLDDLDVQRLAQVPARWPREMVPRDLVYRATATSGTATVHLDGKMLDSWIDIFGGEHDILLTVDHAGDLAGLLSGGVAGGDDLELELSVDGPSLAPRVGIRLADLDLALDVGAAEALALHVDHAAVGLDTATDAGTVEDTVATGAGGKIELSASFQLDPMSFDLHVDIAEPVELSPYLSPRLTEITGSELSGRLHAFGNTEIQRLGELDLKLGAARVTGEAYRTAEGVVHADDVDIELRGTRVADLAGTVDVGTGALDLDFSVVSGDVRRWLRHFRAPTMATSMRGKVSLEGTFEAPEARANLVARGVPVVDRVDADLRYENDVLTVRELQSSAFGGWVRGSAAIALGNAPRIRKAEAQAVNVDLSKLPVVGALLGGELDITASAGGALGSPRASAAARLSGWSVAGEDYRDTAIELRAAPDGTRNLRVSLERVLGGILRLDASLGRRGELDGAVTVRGLPVDGVLALDGGQAVGGGALEAELQLGGTLARPTADGHMRLLRSWLGDSFLGTADLELETTDDGRIGLRGTLFQDRIRFVGRLDPAPPFDLEASVSVRRVELDRFAPEIAAQYGVRGWISGDLSFRGPLLAAAGAPEMTAHLTEAVVLLDNEDDLGRPAPIRVRNRSPVLLSYDGGRLVLDEPAVFEGPTGEFVATGSIGDEEGYDLGLSGTVAVGLLEPYLKDYFEEMSGTLDIEARLSGPVGAMPRITGVVEIEDVALKPSGQDAIVTLPAGKIDFSNDQLALTGLSMVVVDEFSDERSELQVAGGVRLDDFRPNLWAIRVDGQLAGKMLLAVAPQYFSAASGSAEVSVALLGVGEVPDIDGTVELSPEAPLAITPRGLRRELVFTGGLVRFTDQLVELDRVRGWVDDEGQITNVSGEISLENWRPIDVDVSVSARDLPFRVPGELELTLNLRELQVIGGVDSRLELAGEIEVVDGRYVRKFNPVIDALRPARSIESSAPFYEGIPLLANARLNLVLATRSFFVKNNVADIHLSGEVEVTGTPTSPRFAGVVRVEQGSFKFQGVRAKFERTTGSVSFSPYRKFPENTPTLDLQSESNYRDISGQDHLVLLNLQGPLSNLNWDLTTASGLNKGQTLTLIFAGRTPDDVRETLLGDQAIGRGAGDFEGSRSTASSDNTFQAADQLVKDLAGDFFSLLIEDRLRDVTGLDVARLQVGTASVGFHGEKNITKSIRSVLEFERTLRGWSWNARGEYRINDTVSLDGEVNQKKYDDDAEEDQDQLKFKATWRFLVP